MYILGESGGHIYFNVGENVAANTNQIILKKPDGTEIIKDATVGTTNFSSTKKGLFKANEYVFYLVLPNDLDVHGHWQVRAVTTLPTGAVKKTRWQKAIVED